MEGEEVVGVEIIRKIVRVALDRRKETQWGAQMSVDELRALYEQHGQGHVWTVYDGLGTQEQRDALLADLRAVDLPALMRTYQRYVAPPPVATETGPEAPTQPDIKPWTDVHPGDNQEDWGLGLQLIREGKVAAVLMAGGQVRMLSFRVCMCMCVYVYVCVYVLCFTCVCTRYSRKPSWACPFVCRCHRARAWAPQTPRVCMTWAYLLARHCTSCRQSAYASSSSCRGLRRVCDARFLTEANGPKEAHPFVHAHQRQTHTRTHTHTHTQISLGSS